MSQLPIRQDAYGAAMWDYFRGKGGYEIIERDDGYFAPSSGPPAYLAPFFDSGGSAYIAAIEKETTP